MTFCDSYTVNPFGISLPNLTAKKNWGQKKTNISGAALPRGAVVLPPYADTGHGLDREKIGGSDGLYTAVTVAGTNLFDATAGAQNGYGPFEAVTNDVNSPAADDGEVYTWDGGEDGSIMQILVRRDWTTVLRAGVPLALIEGQYYLVPTNTAGVATVTETHSIPIAMTVVEIPAGTYAAATSTELITVRFKGTGILV